MKRTLAQKLVHRKIKKPPFVIYNLLGRVWQLLFFKKLNVSVDYRCDPRKTKGPYIVISNHASRLDYIYSGIPLLPHTCNYVAGYNEFFRSHLRGIFHILQIIPKRNFTADIYTITQIKRIIKRGGRIVIFPEGMSSISGSNQPCALGTGKLLKHLKVPVFVMNIKGGYLTSTKYCLDERPGRVDVVVDRLFTPDDLASMSDEAIQTRVDEAIHHDDYAWNKQVRAAYDGHGALAKNMGDLLYLCPRCGSEHTMVGEGNVLKCSHCGNGATLNEFYDLIPLDEQCVIPQTPRAWFDLQREKIKKEILDPSFEMRIEAELGMLPEFKPLKDQKTSEIVGSGVIILNHSGFSYEGTCHDKPFSFHLSLSEVPTYGMCTDVTRFYTFFNGTFFEFYPKNNVVMKWFIATEELHRLSGGKWRDFPKK